MPPIIRQGLGEPGALEVPPNDVTRLTSSYLALEDERDLLRSRLTAERHRRLHDLRHADSLTVEAARSRADADEWRERCTELERRVEALDAELGQLRQAHAALQAEAWPAHVLRLRSRWRRLPGWVRSPVQRMLAAGSRLLGEGS